MSIAGYKLAIRTNIFHICEILSR